ncbi:hypothetical protein B5P43_17720 [Bacillus sp. SRB_336]|nr:hypothetical protein B5P43_17720 [Bacillus sp. SRB_336]
MALLSLFTVTLLLVMPKTVSGSTVGVVIGLVAPAVVLAKSMELLGADLVSRQWVRRTSPFLYAIVAVFIVIVVAWQLFEPRAGFAYYPALAGLMVGNMFREEPQPRDSHGPHKRAQRSMIVSMTAFCVAAAATTVWTVLAIPDTDGALVDVLILTSILLWTGGFLAAMRLEGRYRARRPVGATR